MRPIRPHASRMLAGRCQPTRSPWTRLALFLKLVMYRDPTTKVAFWGHTSLYNPLELASYLTDTCSYVYPLLLLLSIQSCSTLCDPTDGSPPGSPVPGILQARTLEWVAISFSSAGKWKVKAKSLSRVRLLATPWTAAYQAPPPSGFSRQEDWSGVPLLSPCLSTRSLEIPPQSGWVTHTVNAQGWWFAVWLLSKTCFKGPNNIAILLMIILINGN